MQCVASAYHSFVERLIKEDIAHLYLLAVDGSESVTGSPKGAKEVGTPWSGRGSRASLTDTRGTCCHVQRRAPHCCDGGQEQVTEGQTASYRACIDYVAHPGQNVWCTVVREVAPCCLRKGQSHAVELIATVNGLGFLTGAQCRAAFCCMRASETVAVTSHWWLESLDIHDGRSGTLHTIAL
eukprot:6478474-Amphidinium_carterae.2